MCFDYSRVCIFTDNSIGFSKIYGSFYNGYAVTADTPTGIQLSSINASTASTALYGASRNVFAVDGKQSMFTLFGW